MSLCAHWLLRYEQDKVFPPFGITLHIIFWFLKVLRRVNKTSSNF